MSPELQTQPFNPQYENVYFVINPACTEMLAYRGGWFTGTIEQIAESGSNITLIESMPAPKDTQRILRSENLNENSLIVVGGGDGITTAVAEVALEANAILLASPLGGANDFAHATNKWSHIPHGNKNRSILLDVLRNGTVTSRPVLDVTITHPDESTIHQIGLTGVGVGFDGQAAYELNHFRKILNRYHLPPDPARFLRIGASVGALIMNSRTFHADIQLGESIYEDVLLSGITATISEQLAMVGRFNTNHSTKQAQITQIGPSASNIIMTIASALLGKWPDSAMTDELLTITTPTGGPFIHVNGEEEQAQPGTRVQIEVSDKMLRVATRL